MLSEEFEPPQSHRIKKLGATKESYGFFFFFTIPLPWGNKEVRVKSNMQ